MLKTELKLPFVWYNSLQKQYRYREQNISKEPYFLICGNAALLTFELKKPFVSISEVVTEWQIYHMNNTPAIDLTSQVAKLEVRHTLTDEYIMYKGTAIDGLLTGCYYMKIVKGATTFYSETFQIIPASELVDYLKIEWWNSCDILPILYSTGFKNLIYLDTYTEAIQPEVQEEGDKDGDENFIPTFQRVVCKHKIEFIGPDYLLDSLVLASIHDNIFITEDAEAIQVTALKVTNDYGENFCGSSKVEFELPDAYKKTACCGNTTLEKFYLKLIASEGSTGPDTDIYNHVLLTNITVQAFSDAGATLPLPLTAYPFNVQKQRIKNFNPLVGSPHSDADAIELVPVILHGSSEVVLANTELSADIIAYTGTDPNDWESADWLYSIEPSDLYIVL